MQERHLKPKCTQIQVGQLMGACLHLGIYCTRMPYERLDQNSIM